MRCRDEPFDQSNPSSCGSARKRRQAAGIAETFPGAGPVGAGQLGGSGPAGGQGVLLGVLRAARAPARLPALPRCKETLV